MVVGKRFHHVLLLFDPSRDGGSNDAFGLDARANERRGRKLPPTAFGRVGKLLSSRLEMFRVD
jgi:hypothetical protein